MIRTINSKLPIAKKWIITATFILVCAIFYFLFYNIKYDPQFINHNPNNAFQERSTLQPGETFNLVLGETTAPSSISYLSYQHTDSGSYLSFLNYESKTIYFYNLETKQLDKTIDLIALGYLPSDKVQGYCFIGRDTLAVYNYSSSRLIVFDVKRSTRLIGKSMHNANEAFYKSVYPFVATGAPILYDRTSGNVIMSGFVADEIGSLKVDQEQNILSVFNLNTGMLYGKVNYPKLYWGRNWGGSAGFRTIYHTMSSDKKVVISFMADHNIHVFDLNDTSDVVYFAGSNRIDKIESMKYSKLSLELISKHEKRDYYLNTHSYAGIVYDSFRNVYYRIAEVINRDTGLKERIVIILNSQFDKVGEYRLPNSNYDTFRYFVSKDGLNFVEKTSSEDILTIQNFKYTVL